MFRWMVFGCIHVQILKFKRDKTPREALQEPRRKSSVVASAINCPHMAGGKFFPGLNRLYVNDR